MIRKRLRMTLDFEVTIEGLTDERLREYYRHSTNYEELVGDALLWENLSRQVRLQSALLEDEEALRRYLIYVVTNEVDPSIDGRLGAVFGVGGVRVEEEILETLFSRLEEDDAGFFREVSEAGHLTDNAPVVDETFVVRWARASIEEISLIAEGTIGNTESDNLM